jgi:hypothetical protein
MTLRGVPIWKSAARQVWKPALQIRASTQAGCALERRPLTGGVDRTAFAATLLFR